MASLASHQLYQRLATQLMAKDLATQVAGIGIRMNLTLVKHDGGSRKKLSCFSRTPCTFLLIGLS